MAYFITGGHWTEEQEIKYINMLGNLQISALDGNADKIGLVDATPDDGTRIISSAYWVGRPIKSDGIPTKLERKPWDLKRIPLLDVETYLSGTLLVPQSFKDLMEELEPDVHQFWPMDIYVKGECVARKYWFIACNRLRTLHPTACWPPLNERGFWDPTPDMNERQNDRRVFSTEAIGSHHAWVDKAENLCLFSDVFAERLMGLGLTGLCFRKADEA
ncbi:DUF1629 domain-containing protein [Thalassobius sp. I31.1]|uniref:imm11 family protein n=1 Tax=Thalassobius sp. I31.1 TaxID=2109912 RepID=UPI001E2DB983|nr:DUF1629 domain-containing protein [Thalassobius sp. I31.1]